MKKLFFFYMFLLLTIMFIGCDKDDSENKDVESDSKITFTLGDDEYVLTNPGANVYESYTQIVATRTESGEEYSLDIHLPGGKGTFATDKITFTCGNEKAYCADEISAQLGADLEISITKTEPDIKGSFSGKVVQCGQTDSEEIKNGVIDIESGDVTVF